MVEFVEVAFPEQKLRKENAYRSPAAVSDTVLFSALLDILMLSPSCISAGMLQPR